MSLIIDALKRAQQLRLNGSEGSPILKVSYPKKKRGGRFKKRWIPVGAGLISLCVVLFVFLRPAPSPLATQTNKIIVPVERKLSATVPGKEEPTEGLHYVGRPSVAALPPSLRPRKYLQNRPKEVLSLRENKEPPPMGQALNPAGAGNRTGSEQTGTQASPSAGAPLSGRPSHPQREKKSSETKTSFIAKRGESLSKQGPPPLPGASERRNSSEACRSGTEWWKGRHVGFGCPQLFQLGGDFL